MVEGEDFQCAKVERLIVDATINQTTNYNGWRSSCSRSLIWLTLIYIAIFTLIYSLFFIPFQSGQSS
jgi:hypothetical protein